MVIRHFNLTKSQENDKKCDFPKIIPRRADLSSETPKNGFLSSQWGMFFDEKIGGRILGKHFFNIIHVQNDQTNRLEVMSWSYDTSMTLKVRKMTKNMIFRKSYPEELI